MRDKTTLKGYTKKEIVLADKFLKFLAGRNPKKKFCAFIEPTVCSACDEKIAITRFFLNKLNKANQN